MELIISRNKLVPADTNHKSKNNKKQSLPINIHHHLRRKVTVPNSNSHLPQPAPPTLLPPPRTPIHRKLPPFPLLHLSQNPKTRIPIPIPPLHPKPHNPPPLPLPNQHFLPLLPPNRPIPQTPDPNPPLLRLDTPLPRPNLRVPRNRNQRTNRN